MKLKAMDVKNFRCFEKLRIDFDERLTVLVGANGAGKTAIIDAVTFFLKYYAGTSLNLDLYIENDITDIRIGCEYAEIEYFQFEENKLDSNLSKLMIKSDGLKFRDGVKTDKEFDSIKKSQKLCTVVVRYTATRIPDTVQKDSIRDSVFNNSLQNAFNPGIDFHSTLTWFIARLTQEALEARRLKDMSFTLPDLAALRKAVSSALGEYNEPYMNNTPLELFITHKDASDKPLKLKQLSDGYRTMLALII